MRSSADTLCGHAAGDLSRPRRRLSHRRGTRRGRRAPGAGAGAGQTLTCSAGGVGSRAGSPKFSPTPPPPRAEFRQQTLRPGESLTIVIGYPPGSTRGAPILRRRHTLATAFTVNAVTGGTLIGLLALLLGGVAALYVTRGRDTRVVSRKAAEGDREPVEGTAFAPPDGVR